MARPVNHHFPRYVFFRGSSNFRLATLHSSPRSQVACSSSCTFISIILRWIEGCPAVFLARSRNATRYSHSLCALEVARIEFVILLRVGQAFRSFTSQDHFPQYGTSTLCLQT